MNFKQSLCFLENFLNLEKLPQFPKNTFFNLKRMEHLLRISGHPEKNFFPILVAGTTGKGSTGFFLESILSANGISAGYYHSPHVEDARERIRLGGRMASKELWAQGLTRIKTLLRRHPLPPKLGMLTYFEVLTFLAIWIFSKTGCRVGIFEIGLGGRLDATNVLKSQLVVLTPIHLDHEHFLGRTVAKIAAEKAGIIKKGCYVVSAPQLPEAETVIRKTALRCGARFFKAGPFDGPIGLAGDFQRTNAGVAVQAARILRLIFGMKIDPARYCRAFSQKNWKGRMERFCSGGREFILDGAHNPLSVRALAKTLQKQRRKECWLVFGAMVDKDSRKMVEILSRYFSKVILTRVPGSRARPVKMLLEEAKGLFKCVLPAQNTREAISLARQVSGPAGRIVITGSFYLVGEARKILR